MSTIKRCDRCGKEEKCVGNLPNDVVHHFKVIDITIGKDSCVLDVDLCIDCAKIQFAPVAQTVRADME